MLKFICVKPNFRNLINLGKKIVKSVGVELVRILRIGVRRLGTRIGTLLHIKYIRISNNLAKKVKRSNF